MAEDDRPDASMEASADRPTGSIAAPGANVSSGSVKQPSHQG